MLNSKIASPYRDVPPPHKMKALAGLVGLLLASSSYAADDSDSLLDLSFEELTKVKVIIATGTEQTIADAPSVVTVVTAEDIKLTGATNLTEILETVPGIHIKSSPFGNRPLVRMRGSTSTQTLLMVNGTPMKDLVWAFGIFWKGLPASSIARIEVIRGPGSALYGADASAGVINVITKTATKIEDTELGLRAGSFDTQTAWMQSGGQWHGFDLGMTAEFSTTDGHDPKIKADGQTRLDNTFASNASLAPGKAQYGWDNQDIRFSIANEHWRFLASYMKHDNLETGMTGAGNLDPVTSADDERYDLDLIYKNDDFSKDWGVEAKIHYQDLDYSSGDGFQENPPGATFPDGTYPDGLINHMDSSERQLRFEASSLYSGISNHSIRVGAGYNWQDLYEVEQQRNFGQGPDGSTLPAGGPVVDVSDTPFAFAPEKTRRIRHIFLQDVWTLTDDWQLTIGARYDHYSDFGDTVNPRLALIWKSTAKLTTKLMYGEAFRAPSFQELYADTSRTLANPDLDPEESETIELAFTYAATKNVNLSMNLFHFEISDFIRAQLVPGQSRPQFKNTGKHKTVGVEIEASWQATQHLKLSGNYTYRDPDDNEFRVVEEPEQDAYLRSDWQLAPGWNWNIQANWIADRERADSDPRSNVDNYTITDTTIRYSGLKQWEFAASARNLFDEDAREHTGQAIPDDLPLPERNFYAEVRYKF